ncbi:MAG: hypothetical protein ACRDPG_01050 [Nocardioidaceae bacterium]
MVTGVICSTEVTAEHGPASYACVIDDGTGELGLLFLGRRGVAGMVVGTRCTVEGTANLEGSRLVVWNPLYRIEPSERCGEPSE